MPAAFSASRSISVASSACSSLVRTSAMSLRVGELKPRFGRRRCSGIWPPSKPTLWKPPERARWPLWPRPAVLPQPEAPPRPTRCRSLLEPGAGFSSLSFMSVIRLVDPHEIVDLVDHAAHRRRVDEFGDLVDFFQAEADHRVARIAPRSGQALQQPHLDRFHPRMSSTFLPRRAAISAGVLIAC